MKLLLHADHDTGDIMCLVEIPATYKNVSKRVVKSAATTRTVKIPAEYKTVTKQVEATPASTRTVSIPAKYKNIQVTEVARPLQDCISSGIGEPV